MNFKMISLEITFVVSIMLAMNNIAYAYLGPGAGLGMIGSLVAIIIVVLVIVFGLILYPIRRILKRRSISKQSQMKL